MFSRGSEPTGNGRSSVDEAKLFDIPKREVWEAFKKVNASQDLLRLVMLARHPSPFRVATEVSPPAEHF